MTTTRTRPRRRTKARHSTAARLDQRVPETMKAIAIDRFGGPETLRLRELPVPQIAPTEVLIALYSSGVGSWDTEMRGGWWPEGRPRFPLVLGSDGAGFVAARGARVRRLAVGERVYAYSFANEKGGFHAEYVAVASEKVAHVPDVLDLMEAGALPTIGLTALQGIDDVLRVQAGESVLVFGASGGVGSVAIQFAKLRGARVFAVASGRDGVELARRLEADEAVDGHREDVAAAARSFAPDGLDAALALSGGDALEEALESLRPGARIAHPNGVDPAPKKHRGIERIAYDAVPGVRQFQRLNRAVEELHLVVPLASSYPLADAREAHARLEKGHVVGKVALKNRSRLR